MDYKDSRKFVIGMRPVILLLDEEGCFDVMKYNWQTGYYSRSKDYFKWIVFGRGEVEEVSDDQFSQAEKAARSLSVNFQREDVFDSPERQKNGMKSRRDTIRKANEYFAGHAEYIFDRVSTDLIFDSRDKLEKALDNLKTDERVVRIKDRFEAPLLSGYSDVLVNIQASNGVILEVKLHLKSIHDLYDYHNEIVSETVDPLIREELLIDGPFSKESSDLLRSCVYELMTAYQGAYTRCSH
ncbi:MAG: hypothetical protein PQJ58_11795 [Spirochaetales bacterium]|nr:hypothetical protein [Spirochaetales bacterium]